MPKPALTFTSVDTVTFSGEEAKSVVYGGVVVGSANWIFWDGEMHEARDTAELILDPWQSKGDTVPGFRFTSSSVWG
jgi:hypothetical protein